MDASGLAVLITAGGTALVSVLGGLAVFLRRRPEDFDRLHATVTRLRDQVSELDTRYTQTRQLLYRLRDRYDTLWAYAMKLRRQLVDAGQDPPEIPEEARHHDH